MSPQPPHVFPSGASLRHPYVFPSEVEGSRCQRSQRTSRLVTGTSRDTASGFAASHQRGMASRPAPRAPHASRSRRPRNGKWQPRRGDSYSPGGPHLPARPARRPVTSGRPPRPSRHHPRVGRVVSLTEPPIYPTDVLRDNLEGLILPLSFRAAVKSRHRPLTAARNLMLTCTTALELPSPFRATAAT